MRRALLAKEAGRGRFLFIVDATRVSQSGAKTQNTHSTGNRQRRPKHGRRCNTKQVVRKKCHSFTFGLLITPSGIRIPFQIPHYAKEYCQEQGITHRTMAESAAELIRDLPLPAGARLNPEPKSATSKLALRASAWPRLRIGVGWPGLD